jgi:ribonuclease HI
MEIIFNLMPLDIFVKGIAAKTYLRCKELVKSDWTPSKKKVGHIRWIQKQFKRVPWLEAPNDRMIPKINWQKGFKVDKKSFERGEDISGLGKIKVYTDGSKMNGKVGAGVVAMGTIDVRHGHDNSCIEWTEQEHMGERATVFQAEVYAIELACDELMERGAQYPVTIFSDSQAAIQAINNPLIKSKMVMQAINKLNEVAEFTRVDIRWIKAHDNKRGNEIADNQAKEATELVVEAPEPMVPLPMAEINREIDKELYSQWNERWKSLGTCRQTRIFFPETCEKHSRQLIKRGKMELGTAIRHITGHCFLRRHQSLMGAADSICRLCGDDKETSFHIVGVCEALAQTRAKHFNRHLLDEPCDWEVDQLLGFLREPQVAELEGTKEAIGEDRVEEGIG